MPVMGPTVAQHVAAYTMAQGRPTHKMIGDNIYQKIHKPWYTSRGRRWIQYHPPGFRCPIYCRRAAWVGRATLKVTSDKVKATRARSCNNDGKTCLTTKYDINLAIPGTWGCLFVVVSTVSALHLNGYNGALSPRS